LSSPAITIPFRSDISQLSNDVINTFLLFSGRSLSQLVQLLKIDQQYDDTFAYAYNSLRAYPLIRMNFRGADAVVCPLPTLLFWRITAGLYYELIQDSRFPQAYGDSFQRYAGEVIEKACPSEKIHHIPEMKYGRKRARKDAIDWIIADRSSAIFLECKAKRLSWAAKSALDDTHALEVDIDYMAKAIIQVYKTIGDYIDDQYQHFPFVADRQIYPVIVTLEDWHMFGPTMLERLEVEVRSKMKKEKLLLSILKEMPYSIWSVGDLEVGMQIINFVGIQEFFEPKFSSANMVQWEGHSYMINRLPNHFPAKFLFPDDYKKIFKGILN
jgi:hypothetical protein